MGSDLALGSTDPRRLVVNVIGTAPLSSVTVIKTAPLSSSVTVIYGFKNNEDVHTWQNPAHGVDLVWEDTGRSAHGRLLLRPRDPGG